MSEQVNEPEENKNTMPDIFFEMAQRVAAQAWTQPDTEHLEIEVAVANHFSRALCVWLEEAARQTRNASFYRGLVEECAKNLTPDLYSESFIQDDGGVVDSVLCLKVPGLVAKLRDLATGLSSEETPHPEACGAVVEGEESSCGCDDC